MTQLSRFIHRRLLLPTFESGLKRRKTLRYWNQLEQSQWLTRAEIDQLQFEALERLLAHAHANCPYYRQTWNRLGLVPSRLQSPSDLSFWPVIDRDTVREHRFAMRAISPQMPLITKATGGSSGVPLQFDLDHESNDRRTAAWHRGYGWASAEPGTRQLHLWGVPLGARSLKARVKDRLYHALHRRRIVSCFDADGLASRFASHLEQDRPDVIVAYTNPLYEVSRQLEQLGVPPAHRPRSIVVGAEKLHPFQREQIQRVFGAPVFETYGSREFMLIGGECEHHAGLHLTSEHLLVEILDEHARPAPHGVEGDVVITDIFNYGMPLIRYANGDRAVAGLSDCPCGRGLPLLTKVTGRRLDMLTATDGRLIPGEFFPHLVKDFPAVRRFQVTQEEPERVRFALAADNMPSDDRLVLERLVREALGPGVRVDFESVDHIALTPAGKLQVVINKVPYRRAG